MVDNLAKITILQENISQSKKDKIIQLAKWVHQKTGHARPAAMYRWACEWGKSIPLSKCKEAVM